MRKILITGGTGFLGSHIVRALEGNGDDSVFYTYRSKKLTGSSATGLKIDLDKPKDLVRNADFLKDITHLIHAAALVKHGEDAHEDLREQILEPVEDFSRLLQSLPKLERLVYISSTSAALAGTDPSFYGPGKLLMEGVVSRLANKQDIPYVSLRFPQLYGPGEPHGIFLTAFLNALRSGSKIQLVNDGSVTKDILYVEDAVGSAIRSLEKGVNPGIYTITPPKPLTIKEALDELAKATEIQPNIKQIRAPEAEVRAKSFHFESASKALGYTLQYNLQQGIAAFVKGTEGK